MLAALADVLPELWGGSADLAESNNTTMKGADSFGPTAAATREWNAQPYGRTLHFGIREHAMGAILSGIALHGPTRPYGGTFLLFSDYMRGAVRLAAADGRAGHLRLDARLDRAGRGRPDPPAGGAPGRAAGHPRPGHRPARGCERDRVRLAGDPGASRATWSTGPVGLALTRQDVPVLEGTTAEGVARGGYVLADSDDAQRATLMSC